MPKHTMTFNLPEEATDLDAAQRGMDSYLAIYDIQLLLRNIIKHGDSDGLIGRPLTDEEDQLIEKIADKINDIVNEYNVKGYWNSY